MTEAFAGKPSRPGELHEQFFSEGVAIAMERLSVDKRIKFLPDRLGLLEGGLRADVLALGPGLVPVALEGEFGVAPGPDGDARKRLGQKPVESQHGIEAVVAVVYPPEGRTWSDPEDVAERLIAGQPLKYAIWSIPDSRWPESGWIEGDIRSLRELVVSLSQPQHVITRMAGEVAGVIRKFSNDSIGYLSEDHQRDVAVAVGRPTGLDSQRVVGVVWFNALLFQDRIAEPHGIPLRHSAHDGPRINPRKVLAAWNRIRSINYLSIYDPAVSALDIFLRAMPVDKVAELMTELAGAADSVATASTELFDIGAELFQWVISDRGDAASYYTRPEIAEFLARLIQVESLFEMSPERVSELMIGDFACGTGALLRAVYRRVRAGVPADHLESLHERMMEGGFAGIDISPIAAHLTASSLSNMEPHVAYRNTNIGVVPIGGAGGLTGSVEFLRQTEVRDLFGGTHTQAAHSASLVGSAAKGGYTLRAPYNSFDVVVMNPPYQRPRGGQKLFDVAGVTEKNRQLAVRNAGKIIANTPASMKAGLASVFAVLAVKTARSGGRVGLVLPMTAAAAPTWAATRIMLEQHLDDLVLISFSAGSGGRGHSMSADTRMGEMLVVGTKRAAPREDGEQGDVVTAILNGSFSNMIDASETGRLVSRSIAAKDGRSEGVVMLGDHQRARWGVTPLTGGDPWPYVGASHAGIITLAERLCRQGEMVPLDGHEPVCRVPMTTIGQLFSVGPTHHLIGHPFDGQPIGQFEFHLRADSLTRKDMSLWGTDSKAQTSIAVEPTHYGIVHGDDPDSMRQHASTLFYQRNIDWRSQKILAAVTARPAMGGRAWAPLISGDPAVRFGLALWSNSTLGMAVHWSRAQRQQLGRSLTQIGAIKTMPCPDFRYPDLHAAAKVALANHPDLLTLRLDRAKNAHQDPVRQAIDDAVAGMLGIPVNAQGECGLLRDLATNWCAEPSVSRYARSTKRSVGH